MLGESLAVIVSDMIPMTQADNTSDGGRARPADSSRNGSPTVRSDSRKPPQIVRLLPFRQKDNDASRVNRLPDSHYDAERERPMNTPYKVCPNCGQPAVVSMPTCQRCGHQYRTQVASSEPTQYVLSKPKASISLIGAMWLLSGLAVLLGPLIPGIGSLLVLRHFSSSYADYRDTIYRFDALMPLFLNLAATIIAIYLGFVNL